MQFPDWAPANLISLCEATVTSAPEYSGFYKRLLTYPEMEKIWRLVQEYTPEPGDPRFHIIDYATWAFYFSNVVWMGSAAASKAHLSKNESTEALKEIARMAAALARKVRMFPEIDCMPLHFNALPDAMKIEYIRSKVSGHPVHVSNLLEGLLTGVNSQIKIQEASIPFLPYPNISRAKETYLVRYLGNFFKENLGGKYRYATLAILARTVLDDDQIDKEFVEGVFRKRPTKRGAVISPLEHN